MTSTKRSGRDANQEIDWLERNHHLIEGLDPLGVQVVSVGLYAQLLPGLTNVTDRVRYCTFYPWVVHRYAQSGGKRGDRRAWLEWFRRLEWAYALASIAHEKKVKEDVPGVTGSRVARRLLAGGSTIDIAAGARLRADSKTSYINASEGGFGQYQKPLQLLGVLQFPEDARYPDCQITEWAGRPLVESLDALPAFARLLEVASAGVATPDQLANLGAEVEPAAIEDGGRELRLLRALITASDDEICKTQDPVQRTWRRASVRLALEYVRAHELVEGEFPFEFRWGCGARLLQDGKPWMVPAELEPVLQAWSVYHRNDLLGMALGALLDVALIRLEDLPRTPRALARDLVALSEPPVSVGSVTMQALSGSVSRWIDDCESGIDARGAERWGAGSTWELYEALADTPQDDAARTTALAVRLLGRLCKDTGGFESTGFSVFPRGEAITQPYDVHIGRWLQRVTERHDSPITDFLEELILEWVLFRHLRVATRKLANQGVSTFQFRPEGGALVRVVKRIPRAGLTSPRLRQVHRYLLDLRYLKAAPEGLHLTPDGAAFLKESAP